MDRVVSTGQTFHIASDALCQVGHFDPQRAPQPLASEEEQDSEDDMDEEESPLVTDPSHTQVSDWLLHRRVH